MEDIIRRKEYFEKEICLEKQRLENECKTWSVTQKQSHMDLFLDKIKENLFLDDCLLLGFTITKLQTDFSRTVYLVENATEKYLYLMSYRMTRVEWCLLKKYAAEQSILVKSIRYDITGEVEMTHLN